MKRSRLLFLLCAAVVLLLVWVAPAHASDPAAAYEPDGTMAQAVLTPTDGTVFSQAIDPLEDVDWRSFDAVPGYNYRIQTFSSIDTVIDLFDASGNWLAYGGGLGQGAPCFIDWTVATAGRYYVVTFVSYTSVSGGPYDISITGPGPGRITGHVTDKTSGADLAGIQAGFYKDNGGSWDWNGSVLTDASGYYDSGDLPADDYGIAFHDFSGSHPDVYYHDAFYLGDATPVQIVSGDSVVADQQMAGFATIDGHVTDSQTGSPLGGIEAKVARQDDRGDWGWAGDASTDASGYYYIGGLTPGRFFVAFNDPGRTYASWDVHPHLYPWPSEGDDDVSGGAFVAPGSEVTTIDEGLARWTTLAGHVTDADSGAPLRAIGATAERRTNTGDWYWMGYSDSDASGYYSMGGLYPGTYRLSYIDYSGDRPPHLDQWYDDALDSGSAADLSAPGGLTIVDQHMHLNGRIRGRVTDESTGDGLENATASVYDGNGDFVDSAMTDASGYYEVSDLAAGAYKVLFDGGDGVHAGEWYDDVRSVDAATQITVGLDDIFTADAALARYASISGHVTDRLTRAPIGDVYVSADSWNDYLTEWDWSGDSWTDASGYYRIGSLAPGRYRVGFFAEHLHTVYWDNVSDPADARDIVLGSGGSSDDIDAQMGETGRITGRIAALATGEGIPHGVASAYEEIAPGAWDWVADGRADSSGYYAIWQLSTGNYQVRFTDASGYYAGQFYDDKADLASADDVAVTDGFETGGIDAWLVVGGHITGHVTDEVSGLPLWSAWADAYRLTAPGEWTWENGARADSSGYYDISGLSTGTYHVQFMDMSGYLVNEYYDDAWTQNAAAGIGVVAGETHSSVDAALDPPDTDVPSGSVSINSGAPYVAGLDVTLTLDATDVPSGPGEASGVSDMRFSNGYPWSDWEPYATSKSWTLDGPGSRTVYVQFRDNAGNVSGTVSDAIGVDTSKPSGTVSIDSGAPYAGSLDVTLTLSSTDDVSNVANMRFSNDGASWTTWEGYGTSKDWTLAVGADGARTVYVQYQDDVGNISDSVSDGITVDRSQPTGTVVINSGAAATNVLGVTLTLHGTDAGSPVAKMRFSNDGASWTAWDDYGTSWAWTLAPGAEGPRTVYAQFRDGAGNVSPAVSDGITLLTAHALGLTATPASPVAYGTAVHLSATLSGGAPPAGATVTLYGSTNGGATYTLLGAATDLGGGTYAAVQTITQNTRFYMKYQAAGGLSQADSNAVAVTCKAYMPAPSTPATVRRGVSFTTYGYLKPRHTGYTKLYFYRYNRGYKLYKAVNAKNANYSTYTKYSLKYKLPYAGKWYVKAYHADASHAATWSKIRYFKAR